MDQMQDFDRFTHTICEGDPVKVQALSRGTIRQYWDTALTYVEKLAFAKEASDRANPKGNVPSPRRKASVR